MGYSIGWTAVRNKPLDAALAICALRTTPVTDVQPESEYCAATLPGGWILLWTNNFESTIFSDAALAKLSQDAEAVAVLVEEHAMFSSAVQWKNGGKIWEVWHDAQEDLYHLETTGTLPDFFPEIREAQRALQQNAGEVPVDHIFDIPLATAQRLTGFRHDESEGLEFIVLEIAPHKPQDSKPWWRIW